MLRMILSNRARHLMPKRQWRSTMPRPRDRQAWRDAKSSTRGVNQRTREGCGCFRGLSRKTPRKKNRRKIAGKNFPNREMLQIQGFRVPGKANLLGTLGRHCRDLVPTFRAGRFLRSTVPAFSSFSESMGRAQNQKQRSCVRCWKGITCIYACRRTRRCGLRVSLAAVVWVSGAAAKARTRCDAHKHT